MLKKKAKKNLNLEELREEIRLAREDGLKIISHYKKMEEYYSEWEDRLASIERKITDAEGTGLDRQVIEQYNILQDALAE